MFDRFTDNSRKTMALARKEAQRLNHDFIDAEHILLGLLQVDHCMATDVLTSLDVHPIAVRPALEKDIQPGPPIVTTGQIPFTPKAKRALEASMEEANELGHNYIGTEHLLLGLLRADCIASNVLLNLVIEIAKVRELVLGQAPRTPRGSTAYPRLRTSGIELVDASGRTRASLDMNQKDQPVLMFFDEHGVVRSSFGLRPDGASCVLMGGGSRTARLALGLTDDGISFIELTDAGEATRILVAVGSDGSTKLQVLDKEGKVFWGAPLPGNDAGPGKGTV